MCQITIFVVREVASLGKGDIRDYMLNNRIITKACSRAIKNIISEGTTDVPLFNRAFEIDLLKDRSFKEMVCKAVQCSINKNKFSDLKILKLQYEIEHSVNP